MPHRECQSGWVRDDLCGIQLRGSTLADVWEHRAGVPMGDAGLNRLFSSLEASFEAAISAEDDVLAHDLAMSLRQGRTLTDVAARSGPIDLIQVSGVRLPVEVVGEDFVGVVGVQSMLFPMRRVVLSPGTGDAPRRVQISMLAVVRSVARKRGLATLDLTGRGRHKGRILAAGPDHVSIQTPIGELLVGLDAIDSIGFEDGVALG